MNDLIKTQFYDYLKKFLDEIKKSFSDLKSIIEKNYNEINDDKYILEIKDNLYKYKENFLGKEEELDTFFDKNDIILLKDINLSLLWSKSDSDNKSAIIQYIKVFMFMFETLKKEENDEELDLEENEEEFEEMLKKSLLDNENNLKTFCKNLNDNDNSIINLAKDIAEDLKDNSELNDNNIMNLIGNNGKGLNSLISKITSRIDNDLKQGSLDQNKLIGDAQKMMGTNGNLFNNLFNGMNFNKQEEKSTNMEADNSDIKKDKNTKTVPKNNKPKQKKKK